MKFNFFMTLTVLFLNLTSGVALADKSALNATIKMNDEIKTSFNRNNGNYTGYVLLNKKCNIWLKSSKAVTLRAGDIIDGSVVNILNKSVSKDVDQIGKQSTTQFTFISNDKILEITAACFENGIVLPTLGLPDLDKLVEIVEPKFSITVN
jgi:hypothetical protein